MAQNECIAEHADHISDIRLSFDGLDITDNGSNSLEQYLSDISFILVGSDVSDIGSSLDESNITDNRPNIAGSYQ